MRIPWDELRESPAKAEQLFDLILHGLYGNRVVTTNGAGGDGGVDAWIEDLGQAVEFKSFTKLGASQRKQVLHSLKRAAEKNPRSWVLVAPVHATTNDRQWFASLAGRYPFTMVFHDVRWLESRLAERPDIARYMLTTPHQEVVDLLRELGKEQAALQGGAPDLRARAAALRGRVDELSPIWGMNFTSRHGEQAITVFPKPGSPPQHVVMHFHGDVDDPRTLSTHAAISDAVDYGTGAVIGPGYIIRVDNESLAALNLPWPEVGMVLPDQRVTEGFPRTALLRPRDSDGTLGRPLHLTLHYATVGGRGMEVHGSDVTGMLRTRLRVDRPNPTAADGDSASMSLLLQYGARDHEHATCVDPEALLRTLQVLDALDRTTGTALSIAGSSEIISVDVPERQPTGLFTPLAASLRDLVQLRDEFGVAITLPATWSPRDHRNIAVVAGLLRGEEVQMPLGSMSCHQLSTPDEARTYLEFLETGHGARLDFQLLGLTLPVAGTLIPLDPLYVAFARAQITNLDEVTTALANDEQVIPVELGPAPGTQVLGRTSPFPGPEPDDDAGP